MKVAIVSAYYNETLPQLQRCIESVLNQTYRDCTHIMVSDGKPQGFPENLPIQHIRLPVTHGDYGDTPRLIGAVSAYTQGFDALCWLDADNWFEPNHVETMVDTQRQSGATVVTATRNLRYPNGDLLGVCTESNGDEFNDTNCYFLTREYMYLAVRWGFKNNEVASVGDRHVWKGVRKVEGRVHCANPTVNYTTLIATHYLEREKLPPDGAKVIVRFSENEPFRPMLYTDYVKRVGPV